VNLGSSGLMRIRGTHCGEVVRATLAALTISLIVAIVRGSIGVEWVSDGRPLWAHFARSVVKWSWVVFVVIRSVAFLRTWLRGGTMVGSDGWPGSLDRIAVACTAGLPRFVLIDPMGGAPFALWYGTFLLVVDEYLQVLPAYGPRVRQMFWALATVALVPWGLPFVSTLWPGQMT